MSELSSRRRSVVGEGSVVLVAGKIDERIRESSGDAVYGTVMWVNGTDCCVLIASGDLWYGRVSEVQEQEPESTEE